jgi:ABC-type transport system substrate-binding protein
MDFASIVSKEYADKLQADGKMEQMNQMPLGTGPFTFVAYQPDAVIRYKANETYFKGKEKIDDLVFAITPMHPSAPRSSRPANATSCPIRTPPTSGPEGRSRT